MITRRSFCATWTGILLSACGTQGSSEDAILPQGKARRALLSSYFPSRTYEFVWRNWNLVEPETLGRILDTSVVEVAAVAESMGLPPARPVPPIIRERGYVTLIRRNWHLLPYEQLLQIVNMTPEQLGFTLREDDMLWVKLGEFKPQVQPLRYQPPIEAERRRAAEIRRVVESDFGPELARPGEARFDFVRQLSLPLADRPMPESDPSAPLRIAYSCLAVYGDPLKNPELDPYPEGLLQRCSDVGVNGVWLHAVLRDLAPGSETFPEFGVDSEIRLATLRALVRRAANHNIGVYLYLNEPRAMPEAFFKTRPELAGVHEDGYAALCTSQPAVRQWISDALTHLFSNVPGLAGISTITASENLTNCASHFRWKDCPRCKDRTDADIIAELTATIETGVHKGNPNANVLVSDWGWRRHGDAPDIIARLPKSIWLLSVSEWAKPIERGGIKTEVGEYSISAVGPGPRALRHWADARQADLKVAAEIQFNNSCEIASVSFLPVPDLIAEHLRNLASIRLDGLFIGWTQGGYPSPNYRLAELMSSSPDSSIDAMLDKLAEERFGPAGAPHARKGWKLMSEAFRQYPFHIQVVYKAPVSIGPANPLYPSATGYRATMWGMPYDDLDSWRGPYPPEVFASQFGKVAAGWNPGVNELQLAVQKSLPDRRDAVQSDLHFAQAAGIIFQSVANQAQFILARNALAKDPGTIPAEERERLLAEIRRLLDSEIVLARQLFTIAQEDSRLGFEPTCQYFYLPIDLVEKVVNCRWLLGQFEGRSEARS